MNTFDIDRFLQNIDTVARGVTLMKHRSRHTLNAELARYPAVVQADIGWPPVIDEDDKLVAKTHHKS